MGVPLKVPTLDIKDCLNLWDEMGSLGFKISQDQLFHRCRDSKLGERCCGQRQPPLIL
jgi:hypothetical protein